MKFLALVKKEFRECLPWVILAAIVMTVVGSVILGVALADDADRRSQGGFGIGGTYPSPVSSLGPLLLVVSLGLGIVLGIRQFLPPGLDRAWTFTLHRPVPRTTVVTAKLVTAALGLAVSVGLPWTAMYAVAAAPGRFIVPVLPRVFWEGWLLIGLGLVAYLGTAVSALRPVRWYTTRFFGLAAATGIIVLTLSGAPLPVALAFAGIGLFVLGVQVYGSIQSMEF